MNVKKNLPNLKIVTDYAEPVKTGEPSQRGATSRTNTGKESTLCLPLRLRTTTVAENVDLLCKRMRALYWMKMMRQ